MVESFSANCGDRLIRRGRWGGKGWERKSGSVVMQHDSCPSFKSFATSQDTWRLSALDIGLRIFEDGEDSSHSNNKNDGNLPSGVKVSKRAEGSKRRRR